MEEQLQQERNSRILQERDQNIQGGQEELNRQAQLRGMQQAEERERHFREQEMQRLRATETRRRGARFREFFTRVNQRSLKHVPEKTALTGQYKNRFSSKLTDARRLEKQRNKKSRLFQKNVNSGMIADAGEFVKKTAFLVLDHNIKNDQVLCDREDLTDLAAFMNTEDVKRNAGITKLYMGEGEEKKGQDKRKAMDLMLEELLRRDIANLRLDNDKEIAKNAGRLEKLSWQIMAFDRLAGKNNYFDYLDGEEERTIRERLGKIRSIVTYYQLRKDVINDPIYKSHYNEELSMDFTTAKNEEEKVVAKKLLKAYLAGKDMLEKNGASRETIQRLGRPAFSNAEEGNRFLEEQKNTLAVDGGRLLGEKYDQAYFDQSAGQIESKYRRIREQKQLAEEESKKNSLLPVLTKEKFEEKEQSGEPFEAMTEEQWEKYGGGTFHKIMQEEDAKRIVTKSKGFLVAKKVEGKEGLMELCPSLPASVKINGKNVQLRKSYNMLMKAYFTLLTNEDGSPKAEATEKDGICERFDFLTSGLQNTLMFAGGTREEALQEKAEAAQKAARLLRETFQPAIRQILEKRYVKPNASAKEQNAGRKRAEKEAKETTEQLQILLTHLESPLLSENELSMKKQIGEGYRLLNGDQQKLKEFLLNYPVRTMKVVNGEEVLTERKPTEEEVDEVIREMRADVTETFSGLKKLRDMDETADTVPIPNSCSANAQFIRNMQQLTGVGTRPSLAHWFDAYCLKHPEKVRQYFLKNLHLLSDSMVMKEESIEDIKKTLENMSFGNEESYTIYNMTENARNLRAISAKFEKYRYHAAANISSDKEDGVITVEGLAATSDQYMTTPFTMTPLIGQYFGKEEPVTDGDSITVEGFKHFNQNEFPYAANVKEALKTRLNLYLKNQ